MSKQQSKYWFRLSDYSPQVESDVGMEPQYLIAPVPYCLVYGALNWGFGVMGRTPGFTYDSLIDAYPFFSLILHLWNLLILNALFS